MLHGSDGNIGVIPKDIADKLKGNSKYANEFAINGDLTNIYRIRNGGAPLVLDSQVIDGSITYQLHHKTPISQGGAVFDLDNLVILTPRYHAEVLIPEYHGYNGFKKYFK